MLEEAETWAAMVALSCVRKSSGAWLSHVGLLGPRDIGGFCCGKSAVDAPIVCNTWDDTHDCDWADEAFWEGTTGA